LASKFTKSWEIIRGQKLLNDERVVTYERLMDAEERIAQARVRRGESQATIDEALAVSELNSSQGEPEDDLYLGTLSRYVAALGGHVEVLAVFPDETIRVRPEPGHPSSSDRGVIGSTE
jgi:hypothetical protein